MSARLSFHVLTALLFILTTACKETPQNPFEKEILAIEKEDLATDHPENIILFIGSSSIRMWKSLKSDFPDVAVLNRGFGGSETSDAIYYFDRIVKPYAPVKILFYEGDNDIANGKSANEVFKDFKTFIELVNKNLPESTLGFIAIKPSPSRWDLHKEMENANTMIEELCKKNKKLEFIDIYTPMIGSNGRSIPELFLSDSLHMTLKGYQIWQKAVAPFVYAVSIETEPQ